MFDVPAVLWHRDSCTCWRDPWGWQAPWTQAALRGGCVPLPQPAATQGRRGAQQESTVRSSLDAPAACTIWPGS